MSLSYVQCTFTLYVHQLNAYQCSQFLLIVFHCTQVPVRDQLYFQRKAFVPGEPVVTGGSEYVGTARARANHVDACIHFCQEQVVLKGQGAPIV